MLVGWGYWSEWPEKDVRLVFGVFGRGNPVEGDL